MIVDGINIQTAELEELKEMELGHVATQLLNLASTKRLCSIAGREVIAEYGFKGNFDEVVRQLNEYSLGVECLTLIEASREVIIRRKIALKLHREAQEHDVQYEGIHDAVCAKDDDKVIDLANQALMMSRIAHDQKMCECYTN